MFRPPDDDHNQSSEDGPHFDWMDWRPFTKRVRPTYSDKSTVDWPYEHRKEIERLNQIDNLTGWRGLKFRSLQSFQTWLVIILIGAFVGLVAGCLDVLVEWLSDLKLGRCRYAFHLGRRTCCSGLEPNETCYEWETWSQTFKLNSPPLIAFSKYLVYILTSVAFAGSAALLVKSFAPYAFHTGIPEIKVILSGYVFQDYLSAWVLVIKSIGLALAVASGLSLGKEGPLVHVACCVASLIIRPFKDLYSNETMKREMLSAAAAAGVSVAFGAPLGGVLFVLEELSSPSLPQSTLWRSFVCAIVATVTLQYFDPFKSGKVVLFQVRSVGLAWKAFELVPWMLIGSLGGLFGACFIRVNIEYAKIRRSSALVNYPVGEVLAVAGFTALSSYLLVMTRVPTSRLIHDLFQDCSTISQDAFSLCDSSRALNTIVLLIMTVIAKSLMTAITFGIGIPSGVFLPVVGIGACFGRSIGILMNLWQLKYPGLWWFRSSCPAEGSCISPQVYAVIGAASTVGGITRMTISLVVIIFELTGAVELVLQIMIAVMISKFTADYFSPDGIYEAWIYFRGYPYLSPKDGFETIRDASVSQIMTRTVTFLSNSRHYTLDTLGDFVQKHRVDGFPIVNNSKERMIVGYILTNELRFALNQAKQHDGNDGSTICQFFRDNRQHKLKGRAVDLPDHANDEAETQAGIQEAHGRSVIDLNEYVDEAPLCLDPETTMEIVLQHFQRLELSSVLFASNGKLRGVLSVKDLQKYVRDPVPWTSNQAENRFVVPESDEGSDGSDGASAGGRIS